MENITRTVYGSFLQTCMLLRLPFSVKDSSTLNEKFGIQSGILPNSTEMPSMRYFAIGNGGHRMSVGADSITKPEPIQHRATDAALFHHLPFVLREPTADLATGDRARYGLRREEQHNGVRYIAYYLKRIDMTGVAAAMEYKTVANGTTTTTPFVPDSSNLNPQPPALNSSGVNVTSGDYTAATAKIALSLSENDILELLNVANILYADDNMAIISEIAMCSGVDKVVQSPGVGSATISFNEVIACQVTSHINTFLPLKFVNTSTEILLDVGATEPLFSLG